MVFVSDYREQVIDLGDDASEMLYRANKYTWANRAGLYGEVIADVDHFRGMRFWTDAPLYNMPEHEKLVNSLETDGIGTKIKVTQATSRYDTGAFDLFAMTIDDAAIGGYEPAVVNTYLAVNRLNPHLAQYMEQLANGMVNAARIGRVAVFGGETAILGNMIGGHGNPDLRLLYDWAATVVAKGHPDRLVNNTGIKPGMALVAFREFAFRSNGLTKAQEIAREHFGQRWADRYVEFDDGRKKLGHAVLLGSTIYTSVYVDAIGGMDLRHKGRAAIEGAVHITGGGVAGKLGDMLAVNGYGADIEDPMPTPEVVKLLQSKAKIPDRVAYGMFGMGHGTINATSQPEELIKVAAENGVEAKVIGSVTKETGIVIRSAGARTPGRKLKLAA